jgi:hypothetical protein
MMPNGPLKNWVPHFGMERGSPAVSLGDERGGRVET